MIQIIIFMCASVFQEGKVIDEFTIIKTSHGSYDKSGKKRAADFPKEVIKASLLIEDARKLKLP